MASSNNTVNKVLIDAFGSAMNTMIPQLVEYLNDNCSGKITEDDIYDFLGTKSLIKASSGGSSQKKIDIENGCQYVFTEKSKNRPNEVCGATRFKGSMFCSSCRKKNACKEQASKIADDLDMDYDDVFGPAVETNSRGGSKASSSSSAVPSRGRGRNVDEEKGGRGGRGSDSRAGKGGRADTKRNDDREDNRGNRGRRDVPPRGTVKEGGRGREEKQEKRNPRKEESEDEEGGDIDLSLAELKGLKGFYLEENSNFVIHNENDAEDIDEMEIVGLFQNGKVYSLNSSDISKARKEFPGMKVDRSFYENSKELKNYVLKKKKETAEEVKDVSELKDKDKEEENSENDAEEKEADDKDEKKEDKKEDEKKEDESDDEKKEEADDKDIPVRSKGRGRGNRD